MRRKLAVLVGVLSSVAAASALTASGALEAGAASSVEAGLVGEWHLDEGARCDNSASSTPDSSGNGYTAAVTNACDVPGKVGRAFRFPAGWVSATGAKLRPPTQLSVRAWVRADGSPGPSRYVLAQGSDPGPCAPAAYGMYTSFAGDVNEGGLYFYAKFGGLASAVHAPGVKASQIWDGQWHQVTGTVDLQRVHFYLDGTEIGNGTVIPSGAGFIDYSQPSSRFVIGSYGGPNGTACSDDVNAISFRGDIDEVQVFDIALGSSQPPVGDMGGASPLVRTTGVDQITDTSARVNGTYNNYDYVQPVQFQVEYGKTAALGQKTPLQQLPNAPYITQISATLTGLDPDTDYYARLTAPPSWLPQPPNTVTFHTTGRGAAAPVVTDITASAGPLVAGRPGLLSAALRGPAKRLDWDVTGDGRVDVSCAGNQRSLRFRPPLRVGARQLARASLLLDASVQAVGEGGIGPRLTKSLTFKPRATVSAASRADLRRVNDALSRRPTYVCIDDGVYQNVRFDDPISRLADLSRKCAISDVIVGRLRVSGCWHGVTRPEDIPEAERPVLQLLERELGLSPGSATKVTGEAGFLVSAGPVKVNGVDIRPGDAGASIVVNTAIESIVSRNAAISVGGIPLKHQESFRFVLGGTGDRVRLGPLARNPGGRTVLGLLGLDGDVTIDLVRGRWLDAYSDVTTSLKLPDWLGGTSAETKVRLQRDGTFALNSMSIGPINFAVGPVGITDLKIGYRDDRWTGQMRLCVTPTICIDARPVPGFEPQGGVEIGPGDAFRVAAGMTFPGQGVQLFPPAPVFLTYIGAQLKQPPWTLLGTAKVTAAGIYEIDGALALAFPSSKAPYRLDFGSFPAEEKAKSFERFTIAASATAYLSVRPLPRIQLGNGYFLYHYPSYMSFGGGVNTDFFGVIRIIGTTSGWFDLDKRRFNLHGRADSCLADIPLLDNLCWGSIVNISSKGVGGCISLGLTSVGGGVIYDPFKIFLWPLDGCEWSPFAERQSARVATGSRAGDSIVVRTNRGDPSRVIELKGTDGAPRVRVTTADGNTLESTAGPGFSRTDRIRILRSESLKLTVVGLVDPAAGTHTIELLPGSAISSVREAEDQPAARATARVSGSGGKRTLTYDILQRKAQRVTFLETGPGGSREIGTTAGGKGRIEFTPTPGSGTSRIEAEFELAGLPAERRTLTRFTAPSPRLATVQRIRARHGGTTLRVTWQRVQQARSYDVRVTLSSGGERYVRTTRPTLTLRDIPRWSSGRVTIRALAPLRESTPAGVAFAASGPRPTTPLEPFPAND
jgi:concanavalin A-like lectin/glucanase superfamily protein